MTRDGRPTALRGDDRRLRRRDDRRARAELAARYLPLARALALRYRHCGEPLDDLVQVASLGLVKAIERWDPDRGPAFATFAVPTILGELRRHFRDHTWLVKPPRATQELSLRVPRARERLWGALGREPTVAELAAALERSPEQVAAAVEAAEAHRPQRLDAPLKEFCDQRLSHVDLLGGSDPRLDAVDDRLFTEHLVGMLDRRARQVVRMRFELDLRQHEISERVGISQMHVSRILRHALETLHRNAAGIPPAASRAAPA
jgi:RNA polymerase sigma-B factor